MRSSWITGRHLFGRSGRAAGTVYDDPAGADQISPEEPMIKITKASDTPTRRGPAEWFTGTVWQDPIVEAPAPARIRAVRVSFEPGARTAWHTHPLGQTLHVLTGVGRVQSERGPVREI